MGVAKRNVFFTILHVRTASAVNVMLSLNYSLSKGRYLLSTVPHFNLRVELILQAVKDLGEPYMWGGQTDEDGGDCSGKVQTWLLKIPGLYEYPPDRTADSIFRYYKRKGCRDVDLANILPGCLCFFAKSSGRITHIKLHVLAIGEPESTSWEAIDASGTDAGSGVTDRRSAREHAAQVRWSSSRLHGHNVVDHIIDPFEVLGPTSMEPII